MYTHVQNAVAGKISAARELARRLAEEKNAAIKPEVCSIFMSSSAFPALLSHQ
jgi:hypothetical protein